VCRDGTFALVGVLIRVIKSGDFEDENEEDFGQLEIGI